VDLFGEEDGLEDGKFGLRGLNLREN